MSTSDVRRKGEMVEAAMEITKPLDPEAGLAPPSMAVTQEGKVEAIDHPIRCVLGS